MFRQARCREQAAPVGLWLWPEQNEQKRSSLVPKERRAERESRCKQTGKKKKSVRWSLKKQVYTRKNKLMHRFSFFFFSSFLRQTQTFSTDVLQHEYRIYIFIYFIHTFSKLDQNFVTGRWLFLFLEAVIWQIAFVPASAGVALRDGG